MHTCHKLWTEICEIRKKFKGDLIKFCEIFTKITLELPQNSQKPLFWCKKLVINTTKCDLCLFLHKMYCKMAWKFCEIWKILWELASRWTKFCKILSHSARYGMYVHANNCTISIVFHENGTILKMEGKEVKETIKTINFSYFIIKFKILVYQIKICFYINFKSEGKSGLLITKFWVKKVVSSL